MQEIKSILQRIENKFNRGWSLGQIDIPLRVIASTAHVPRDLHTLENIKSMIEYFPGHANYGVTVLSPSHLDFIKRETAVENALRSALETRSLELYYQPIRDIRRNQVVAGEALTRLYDEGLGYVPSEEFIRIAEKNGMIIDIGNYVFEETCRFISKYPLESLGLSYIELNLSLYQCLSPGLTESFLATLAHYDVPIEQVNLEITETISGEDSELMSDTFQRMQRAGFRFSLDDFGTGYSNLSQLFNTPYENIKIDRSFIWNMNKNQ